MPKVSKGAPRKNELAIETCCKSLRFAPTFFKAQEHFHMAQTQGYAAREVCVAYLSAASRVGEFDQSMEASVEVFEFASHNKGLFNAQIIKACLLAIVAVKKLNFDIFKNVFDKACEKGLVNKEIYEVYIVVCIKKHKFKEMQYALELAYADGSIVLDHKTLVSAVQDEDSFLETLVLFPEQYCRAPKDYTYTCNMMLDILMLSGRQYVARELFSVTYIAANNFIPTNLQHDFHGFGAAAVYIACLLLGEQNASNGASLKLVVGRASHSKVEEGVVRPIVQSFFQKKYSADPVSRGGTWRCTIPMGGYTSVPPFNAEWVRMRHLLATDQSGECVAEVEEVVGQGDRRVLSHSP